VQTTIQIPKEVCTAAAPTRSLALARPDTTMITTSHRGDAAQNATHQIQIEATDPTTVADDEAMIMPEPTTPAIPTTDAIVMMAIAPTMDPDAAMMIETTIAHEEVMTDETDMMITTDTVTGTDIEIRDTTDAEEAEGDQTGRNRPVPCS